jgi:hypothetical protein
MWGLYLEFTAKSGKTARKKYLCAPGVLCVQNLCGEYNPVHAKRSHCLQPHGGALLRKTLYQIGCQGIGVRWLEG